MAKSNKLYFKLLKLSHTIDTAYGEVNFSEYKLIDLSTYRLEGDERHNIGVKEGNRVRVVKGRKLPIGTEGTVKWCGPNNFGYSFNDALTGRLIHLNPSILLTLDDGSEVWTNGRNCINITNTEPKDVLEFSSDEELEAAREELRKKKDYYKDYNDVWYKTANGEICRTGYSIWGLCSKSFSVYHYLGKACIEETEKEVAAVIDDFATDTYMFVRFSKEAKHNNLIEIVSTGEARDMNDMWRGDTGLGDALKAFESYTKISA